MVKLTPRLKMIASLVEQDSIIADIGTDHALIPVYLTAVNRIKFAIASDIKDGPLERARLQIEKFGFSEKIKLVKSDGLIDIPKIYNTIIIAGMGGNIISEILEKGDLEKNVLIILQPMTAAENLRLWLYSNNYEITQELAVSEKNKIYTVIKAKAGEKKAFSEIDIYISKSLKPSPDSERYIKKTIFKFEKKLLGLEKSVSEQYDEKQKIKCLIKQAQDLLIKHRS